MTNPNPTWTSSDWHAQGRLVGFDTDEESAFYMDLVRNEAADEARAEAEAEEAYYAAKLREEQEENDWHEASYLLGLILDNTAAASLADWELTN
jgi:hypothetical protein